MNCIIDVCYKYLNFFLYYHPDYPDIHGRNGVTRDLKSDKFLNGLMEDENGNIILEQTGSNKETTTLNYTHRPTRNENIDKVQSIKKLADNIKASVIKNMIESVAYQSPKDALVEYPLAFDFRRLRKAN